MPTGKLYWDDPLSADFDTEGATVGSYAGRPSLVLARTLFYPEGGGQLSDTGELTIAGKSLHVGDVQIDDAGVIHHLVTAMPEGEISGAVHGRIDAARRRDHMAQHTAQHMLSRALVDVARAETVSARLGAASCTIDLNLSEVSDAALGNIEDLVNAVVRDDVGVRALYPSAEELLAMKLRRTPKVTENVRVIDVERFDLTPCGGTHCTRTGQIGQVTVAGTERAKGKVRLSFHAGRRALVDAREKQAVLSALAADFTCGLLDVPVAVAKLRGELKARLDALSGVRGELATLIAERVLATHPADPTGTTAIVLRRDRDDVGMLRSLAGRLAARADVVAICTARDGDGDDLAIVVQRGEKATFDCGRWLKEVALAHGGRGGGRPERAEGRVPRTAPLETLAVPLVRAEG